jgi:sulfide:quinone oxidoreductase
MGKTVMVLGGGIGGVVAASRLRRRLPREHRVILVEREADHLFQPSLLWLMLGRRRPGDITRPIERLKRRGLELWRGTVEGIDPARRAVAIAGREHRADYIVIALGAELAPETVPGLVESGHNLYTLAGATAVRDALAEFRRGRIAVLISAMPFKCPAAPYEASMLIDCACRRRGVRGAVSIDLYTPEPGPMPVAGPEVSKQVRQLVESKNIGVHTGHAVKGVDPETRRIEFADGKTADFDLLVYVPPHRAPAFIQKSGLAGAGGWAAVDRATLATNFPGVYAIGDITGIPLAIGKPLPKAGVFAHGEAEVVARNIVAGIRGEPASARFTGDGACFVEAGDGRAGYGSGNFYAEPAPRIALRPPSRWLHLGKLAYEKFWLYRWF